MKKVLLLSALVILTIIISISCKRGEAKETAPAAATELSPEALVARGNYLVGIMGCHDCHSPKKMTAQGPALDEALLLSGHPAQMPIAKFDTATTKNWVLFNMNTTGMIGPWGASFAANLTSDETGIGNWTEDQFKKAIKEGKFKGMEGTRPLLPPMPWQNFAHIQDEDVKAIFAFLKSTKPVSNVVPAAIPPSELGKYIQ